MSKQNTKTEAAPKTSPRTHRFVSMQRVELPDNRHLWEIVTGRMTSDMVVTEFDRPYPPDEFAFTAEKHRLALQRLLLTEGNEAMK